MADADFAARLAAIEDDASFVEQATRYAQAHNITLSAAGLLNATHPDPLGLARWSDSGLAGSALPPRAWLPIAVAPWRGAVHVDWAWFGAGPLRAPFYENAIRRALSLPFNRAFRYRTGLDDLIAQAEMAESVAPSGFIFHMSRCGSTLVAQMLAALPGSVVISEAAPIDAVVQLGRGLSDDDAARAVRAMIAVFGRTRGGQPSDHSRRYVVKLDCWHTLALPLFRRAFPDVPWVFLYRDPVEVLVSQMRQRGMQMVPQFLPPSFYGITDENILDEDYCARVLAAVCRAVIEHQGRAGDDLGRGLILNYRQLPDAVWTAILPHFGISCSDEERDNMRRAARQDAKAPTMPFAADADTKQREATATVRRAADRHLGEIYNRLENLRLENLSVKLPPREKAPQLNAAS
jgi:hypothetical protein